MEVQLTDFENAAFVVFMLLLTRTIRSFSINFYIPITKVPSHCLCVMCAFIMHAQLLCFLFHAMQVDENMRRAHARGAALMQRFYFRKVVHKGTHHLHYLRHCCA